MIATSIMDNASESSSQPSRGAHRTPMEASMEDISSGVPLHQAAALYECLAEMPTIAKAEFVGLLDEMVLLTLNYKDHATMTTSQRALQILLEPEAHSTSLIVANQGLPGVPVDPAVKLDFAMHSDSLSRVRLREETVEGKKRRFVEVWINVTREYCIEVTESHGSFCTDETFSSSSAIRPEDFKDETVPISILYEAGTISDPSVEDPLERFRYQAPMGEKFAKDLQPGLFLLRIWRDRPASLVQLVSPEKDRILGQACFIGTERIAATGYDAVSGGRRLGQVYCTNRPSTVQTFRVPPDESAKEIGMRNRQVVKKAEVVVLYSPKVIDLSTPGRSARSPRSLPEFPCSGDKEWTVIWLETPSEGPHNSSSAVLKATERKDGVIELEEVLPLDHKSTHDGVEGQYLGQLARQPFFRFGQDWFLVLSSIHECQNVVRVHRVRDRDLTWECSTRESSEALLATSADRRQILTTSTHFRQPPQLCLWDLEFKEGSVEHACCSVIWAAHSGGGAKEVASQLKAITSRVVDIPHTGLTSSEESDERPEDTVEAIVISAHGDSEEAPPCILYPHGGPHGASTIDWSPGVAALVLLGYTVILPNYHGSTGRSPAFVDSLIGKCGTLDIDDCVATIKWAIEEGVADKDQVYFQGGSHGGFIGCHVAGRSDVKGLWKAIALRNPVTHIGEMWATTDIRDWDMAELGLPYSFDAPPPFLSPENFKALSDASPARLVDKVEAPVLMLLGDSDQRVPPTQGLAYYHALCSRIERQWEAERSGVGRAPRLRAECLWFKGADHALDTVESARGAWLATWKWFEEARRGREVE
ncbi:alpha/beta-hydrolase [Microstroma glucosiphilum]|uniref:Dipeptidyl-peptidase V n=1 Tax=Pseudomicrostroma glucosiphilum TaxID=1684307 RepID=A0A316U4N7_9BASI|nr:alpha/beta-hydrolase [Pseudomicrostroma glucosiphilum]PWN17905.1 alpha/beta-hydrolase [Pseudomicrostroma glucosiphilum]